MEEFFEKFVQLPRFWMAQRASITSLPAFLRSSSMTRFSRCPSLQAIILVGLSKSVSAATDAGAGGPTMWDKIWVPGGGHEYAGRNETRSCSFMWPFRGDDRAKEETRTVKLLLMI